MLPVWDYGWSYAQKQAAMRLGQLATHVRCARHGWCEVFGHVDLDVSGTPCQDVSSANNNRLGVEGPNNHVCLAWCRLNTLRRTKLLFHECVTGNPWEVTLQPNLPLHSLYPIVTQPSQFMHSWMRRLRQYVFGAEQSLATVNFDIHNALDRVIGRMSSCCTLASDGFVAPLAEINQEAAHLSAVRGLHFVPFSRLDDVNLRFTLSPKEAEYEVYYTAQWWNRHHPKCKWDDLVVGLNDNPRNRLIWSAVNGQLPTLRTGTNRLWIPSKNRWVTLGERMSYMGFPVYTTTSALALNRPAVLSSRMAGNAMHLVNLMCVLTTCLCCTRLV